MQLFLVHFSNYLIPPTGYKVYKEKRSRAGAGDAAAAS